MAGKLQAVEKEAANDADAGAKKPSASAGLPTKAQLFALAKKHDGLQATVDEANTEKGAATKAAQETYGLELISWKWVQKLRRMDATKVSAVLKHFDHYVEVFGVDSQEELFDDDKPVAKDEAAA